MTTDHNMRVAAEIYGLYRKVRAMEGEAARVQDADRERLYAEVGDRLYDAYSLLSG